MIAILSGFLEEFCMVLKHFGTWKIKAMADNDVESSLKIDRLGEDSVDLRMQVTPDVSTILYLHF